MTSFFFSPFVSLSGYNDGEFSDNYSHFELSINQSVIMISGTVL